MKCSKATESAAKCDEGREVLADREGDERREVLEGRDMLPDREGDAGREVLEGEAAECSKVANAMKASRVAKAMNAAKCSKAWRCSSDPRRLWTCGVIRPHGGRVEEHVKFCDHESVEKD